MSPRVNEINIGGYTFYFKSKEGGVVHVHVDTPSGIILWWLGKEGGGVVSLKRDSGVKGADKRKSKRYAEQHYDIIVEAWDNHFGQAPRTSHTVGPFIYGIEDEGFWLYVNSTLYWIGFDRFPIFLYATDEEIIDFEYSERADNFHWPAVDADLGEETLQHPEKYPLRATHKRERENYLRQR